MSSNEYKENILKAGDIIIPHLFQKLIEDGKFDIEKRNDLIYIKSILENTSLLGEVIHKLETSILIHNEFIELAKHSVKIDKKYSAIILLATTIEHQLNYFYREILKSKDLKDTEITQIIKKNNFDGKLGWLMKFTTNTEFPNELKKRINKITELRNSIVHYKSAPGKFIENFNGSTYNYLKNEIENINFNETFDLIEEIDKYIENLLIKKIESRKIALEIFITYRTQTPIIIET